MRFQKNIRVLISESREFIKCFVILSLAAVFLSSCESEYYTVKKNQLAFVFTFESALDDEEMAMFQVFSEKRIPGDLPDDGVSYRSFSPASSRKLTYVCVREFSEENIHNVQKIYSVAKDEFSALAEKNKFVFLVENEKGKRFSE